MGGSTKPWPTPSTAAGSAADADPKQPTASFWRSVGYLTSVGWMIALPIAAGVLVGRFLDQYLGSGSFWTLALLGAGIGVAALEFFLAAETALRRRDDA